MGALDQITVSESLTRQRLQNQKPVDQAFGVAHGYGRRRCRSGREHRDAEYKSSE